MLEHGSDDSNRQSIKENESQGITTNDINRQSIEENESWAFLWMMSIERAQTRMNLRE